jgi:DNA-binding MarR family transcriptional regulator
MGEKNTPGFLLFLVSRAHHNLADRVFNQIGVCRGQAPVLFELGKQEGISQNQLAERLELTEATLTNTLQRMEACGFVTRQRDPSDGRFSRIYLTETGREMLTQANNATLTIDQKAFAGFSSEEQQLLTDFLEKIHTNLTRE